MIVGARTRLVVGPRATVLMKPQILSRAQTAQEMILWYALLADHIESMLRFIRTEILVLPVHAVTWGQVQYVRSDKEYLMTARAYDSGSRV